MSDSKSENNPSGSKKTPRLPSLRGPRDLTLGGVRKKTFAPNIPVRKERVKQEIKDDKPSSTPKKERSRKDWSRGRERGRGRGRGRQEIIQSHSIFEAGPSAEAIGKRSDSGFSGSGGFGATKQAIEKPTIKKEEFNEEYDKAKSEEVLKNLEGDVSFVADLENDEFLFPISLPMSESTWPPRRDIKTKQDVIEVKQEMKIPKKKTITNAECSEIFLSEEDGGAETDLILFQLPDTLPAVAPSNEGVIKVETPQGSMKIKKESDKKAETVDDKYCTLDQLSEGFVGKLQILKSGRCRLVLGQIVLDLNKGAPTSFHEEVVSVRLPPEEDISSQGHMTVVGDVAHKIVCMPDMEHLILQAK